MRQCMRPKHRAQCLAKSLFSVKVGGEADMCTTNILEEERIQRITSHTETKPRSARLPLRADVCL